MNTIVTLEEAVHRGAPVFTLRFGFDAAVIAAGRKLAGFTWSQTMKCWYVPRGAGSLATLRSVFGAVAQVDDRINNEERKVTGARTAATPHLQPLQSEEPIERFRQYMQSKRYSPNTVGTYTEALRIFLRFFSSKQVNEITEQDLVEFNNRYILANRLSASYQNQVVNAVKLFFGTIEKKKLQPELIHRPKRAKVLPNVLSKEEVKALLSTLTNIKHRLMLSLVYACGLRRSELLNLRLSDILADRTLIMIRQGKGKKDRVVPLSPRIDAMLQEYLAACRPGNWLFEGQQPRGSQYDESSLANVLRQALEKSGIRKPVTLHWLRHSYATHLLEGGTDIRYIQELLGHSSSRTTEIYTHVSRQFLQRIVSPFDTL